MITMIRRYLTDGTLKDILFYREDDAVNYLAKAFAQSYELTVNPYKENSIALEGNGAEYYLDTLFLNKAEAREYHEYFVKHNFKVQTSDKLVF